MPRIGVWIGNRNRIGIGFASEEGAALLRTFLSMPYQLYGKPELIITAAQARPLRGLIADIAIHRVGPTNTLACVSRDARNRGFYCLRVEAN